MRALEAQKRALAPRGEKKQEHPEATGQVEMSVDWQHGVLGISLASQGESCLGCLIAAIHSNGTTLTTSSSMSTRVRTRCSTLTPSGHERADTPAIVPETSARPPLVFGLRRVRPTCEPRRKNPDTSRREEGNGFGEPRGGRPLWVRRGSRLRMIPVRPGRQTPSPRTPSVAK
jgi:hypothetical protein